MTWKSALGVLFSGFVLWTSDWYEFRWADKQREAISYDLPLIIGDCRSGPGIRSHSACLVRHLDLDGDTDIDLKDYVFFTRERPGLQRLARK